MAADIRFYITTPNISFNLTPHINIEVTPRAIQFDVAVRQVDYVLTREPKVIQ